MHTSAHVRARTPLRVPPHSRMRVCTRSFYCGGQSYILSFNYYVVEIHETEMTLICQPLAQGQRVPEMLEAIFSWVIMNHVFSLP